MKYFTLLVLILAHQAFSQTFIERELKTSIDEVTIYLQGGLISRTGEFEVPPGKSVLKLKSLSPHIDEKSIQVKASGDFTILSVNHIKLTLFDQIPVSVINDITVAATDLSNGKRTEETGEVTWEIDLKPQEQKEIQLSYEVKYPKNEKVNLE